MNHLTVGFCLCGSFCTVNESLKQLALLAQTGANIIPILSPIVQTANTRFITADDLKTTVEMITGNQILTTIEQAEPIGPKGLLDLLIIAPCTGNTLSKIALGITDTPVTMAAKAQLRNNRPVLLGIATNDALSGSASNLGRLMGMRNIYFVPFGQDDAIHKPTSMICDFEQLIPAAKSALQGNQLQPVLIAK